MATVGAHSRQVTVGSNRGSSPHLRSRILTVVNIPLLLVVASLTCYGILIVWSVTSGSDEYSISHQVMGVCIGLLGMSFLWWFDYRKLAGAVLPLLILDVVLLLSPHLPGIGYTSNGATSWIVIFGQQLQPGEFSKVVTIVLFAALIARYEGHLDELKSYLKAIVVILIPIACLMTQPDLGTALVMMVIGATILFIGGARRRYLVVTLGVCAALVCAACLIDPILDNMAGSDVFIKEYQWNRILVFLNNDIDPTGVSYNINQAKIAIGSGGLFGKGIGNATQSTLGFLPEAPTDFIFCPLAEQLGFLGALLLLALYATLFFMAFRIARRSADLFGRLIVFGICGMWVFQIIENIGMDCGLMPITGIPLPFMSYGSSFMITNFMVVGLMLSVWARRFNKARDASLMIHR
jgi:rod shape determining protein RodA